MTPVGLDLRSSLGFGLWIILVGNTIGAVASPTPKPLVAPLVAPSIVSLLKEGVYKRVLEREVMVHASLEDLPVVSASAAPGPVGKASPVVALPRPGADRPSPSASDEKPRKYSFYTAMSVNSSLKQTRAILTNYDLYAKMIPYVESTVYTEATHILSVEGGIWKFKLKSYVLFDERGDRWIHYRIVGGHFTGLEGDILFEPSGEKSTLVLMRGSQDGTNWPPRLVIEKGAEIVFGFSAQRMRSYVESQKKGGP